MTAIVALATIAGGASVAVAHTDVQATSPAGGTTAATSLTRVTVTFDGPLRRGTVRVVGPGNRVVSRGSGGRDPRNIRRLLVALRGPLRAGAYRATWTIVAADGHAQKGSFRFRLRR